MVYLPAGTYRLRRPLTITNSKVVLRGDGERRTTILIPISLGDYFKGSWTQTPGGGWRLVPVVFRAEGWKGGGGGPAGGAVAMRC